MNYSSICLLAKNENAYINEWLDWHLSIGFDHIYIYDNESDIPLKHTIYSEYLSYCTFNDWTSNDYQAHMQHEAYAHFLKTYACQNEWTAFIDADEFVRILNGDSINSFLKDYDSHNGLYIEWITYNANGHIYQDLSVPVRERFTQTVPYTLFQIKGKSIVKPNNIRAMSAHFPIGRATGHNIVDSSHKEVYLSKPYTCPLDKIVIDHYFTKSYEEWISKVKKGSCCSYTERKIHEFFILNPDLKGEI